uniref:Uncharacterized protein n=1 Tax=Dendroctonus ponderosae TaxID=77166 RepID=J3JWB9_DENPD|nr:unknown [Dendroctonus ponderosae]
MSWASPREHRKFRALNNYLICLDGTSILPTGKFSPVAKSLTSITSKSSPIATLRKCFFSTMKIAISPTSLG